MTGIATNKGNYIILPNDFSLIQSNNNGSVWISYGKDNCTKILKLDSELNTEEFDAPLDYTSFKKDNSIIIQDDTLYALSSKHQMKMDKFQLIDSQFKKIDSINIEKNPGPAPTSRTFKFSFFGALLNKIFNQASLLKLFNSSILLCEYDGAL